MSSYEEKWNSEWKLYWILLFLLFIFKLWEGCIFLWIKFMKLSFFKLIFLLINVRCTENNKENMMTESYKENKTHMVGKFLRMGTSYFSCPLMMEHRVLLANVSTLDAQIVFFFMLKYPESENYLFHPKTPNT